MSTLDEVKKAVLKYGKNGDNSFECVGVDCSTTGISDIKIYRYYRSRNHTIVDWDRELDGSIREIAERLEKRSIIRLREMSKSQNGLEKQYKIYFSVKTNIPFAQHFQETNLFFEEVGYSTTQIIRAVENHISSYLSPNRSPLLMLGVEMKDGLPVSLKVHMTLEKFPDYSQQVGKKLFFGELKDMIAGISKIISLPPSHDSQYTKIGSVSSNYLFYPFLIGINQYDKSIKYKLYFRMKYNGLNNEQIHDCMNRMMKSFGELADTKKLVGIASELAEIGLFMEGFALESEPGSPLTVKLYFFPLPTVKR